jgi:hypothetical protein
MPLDVLGRTRATLMKSASLKHAEQVLFESCFCGFPCPKGLGNLLKLHRDGDRPL